MRLLLIIMILLLSTIHAAADTIKVLILNEDFQKIPGNDEKIVMLGSKEGDLLLDGSHYTGTIEVWTGDSGLYLITELSLEEYVKGVVMSEVGPNWETEALKAQAVISRTYALSKKKTNGGSLFHLTSSALHQVFKGNNFDVKTASAVQETAGEILTFKGNLIEPFYHSTCGGRTENPEDVFGRSYPYLVSVESTCDISPLSIWERKILLDEIEQSLNISGIKEISVKSFTSTNRVKELTLICNSGTITIKAKDLRKALGWSRLPSTFFTITQDGDSVIFQGRGYGHGVGLCQWCALKMAREGKIYKEILSFFYPGTTLEFHESR